METWRTNLTGIRLIILKFCGHLLLLCRQENYLSAKSNKISIKFFENSSEKKKTWRWNLSRKVSNFATYYWHYLGPEKSLVQYITIPKVPKLLPVKTSCVIELEFEYNMQFEFDRFLTIFNIHSSKEVLKNCIVSPT